MFQVVAKIDHNYYGITQGKIYTVRRIRLDMSTNVFFIYSDNEKWQYVNANYFKEIK